MHVIPDCVGTHRNENGDDLFCCYDASMHNDMKQTGDVILYAGNGEQ